MKAHLLFADRDFAPRTTVPISERGLIEDLELETIITTMAAGDAGVAEVAREAMLAGVTDIDVILYRQSALKDCIENAAEVRELYKLVVETIDAERHAFLLGMMGRTPSSVLFRAVGLLELLEGRLQGLRSLADRRASAFTSTAFANLFEMLRKNLSDAYLKSIHDQLWRLRFPNGLLLSAGLGNGNKGTDYVLRKGGVPDGWLRRALKGRVEQAHSFRIADQDESGARALTALKDRGIASVADALAQSTDHILSFFMMMQTELAFYVGCLNLHDALASLGRSTCTPQPCEASDAKRSAMGLYDASLALTLGGSVIENDFQGDGKPLVIITGANRGGKSTFLRSIGVAQLMMQCGMFVAAQSFAASVCERLFTHYKREEDPTMRSGKFDEELSRMSAIVDNLVPSSLLLLNESFSATAESEGAEIARQVVTALLERSVTVYFVTHQYELAASFGPAGDRNVLFLRAERHDDGTRTFKIKPGAALQTSYGKDLFDRIFGVAEAGSAEG